MNEYIVQLLNIAREDKVEILSVGGVIVHQGKLLMLKRKADDFMPNIYEFPGGGIEEREHLADALLRELLEETNCTANRVLGYIGCIDFKSSKGLLTRRFNFLIDPKLPLNIVLSEHDNYQWIDPQEANQYPITDQTKRIINLVAQNNIHFFT